MNPFDLVIDTVGVVISFTWDFVFITFCVIIIAWWVRLLWKRFSSPSPLDRG